MNMEFRNLNSLGYLAAAAFLFSVICMSMSASWTAQNTESALEEPDNAHRAQFWDRVGTAAFIGGAVVAFSCNCNAESE